MWQTKTVFIFHVLCYTLYLAICKVGGYIKTDARVRQKVSGESIYDDGENKRINVWYDRRLA